MVFFGKILKTRGNRGEVLLERSPSCPEPNFESNTSVILKSEKYQIEKEIEYIRKINDTFILKCKGIDSIGEAFKVVGYSLFFPEVKGYPEKNNDWLGYRVRDIQNIFWGNVRGIRDNGFNQILEVENGEELIDIPLCEDIIKETSKERKLIVIDPPEGLRKLNR